jgi:hypothetical protein
VALQQKVKEWLLKKITLKEEKHLDQDLIAIIQVQSGFHDSGRVERGFKNK